MSIYTEVEKYASQAVRLKLLSKLESARGGYLNRLQTLQSSFNDLKPADLNVSESLKTGEGFLRAAHQAVGALIMAAKRLVNTFMGTQASLLQALPAHLASMSERGIANQMGRNVPPDVVVELRHAVDEAIQRESAKLDRRLIEFRPSFDEFVNQIVTNLRELQRETRAKR